MRLMFAVQKMENGWAFVFGGDRVIGIGRENQRYFETHEAIVEKLDSLGINRDQYEDLEVR